LATKSTRKKPQFNKQDVAKQLAEISHNVSKRGAFVVVYTDGLYNVFEALSKKVVLHSIPQKSLAQTLCVRLNLPKTKTATWARLKTSKTQKYILQYCDIINESLFYKHTIKTSDDEFRREVAFVRLDESIRKGKYYLNKIKGVL
jgi:hypothetical protein